MSPRASPRSRMVGGGGVFREINEAMAKDVGGKKKVSDCVEGGEREETML